MRSIKEGRINQMSHRKERYILIDAAIIFIVILLYTGMSLGQELDEKVLKKAGHINSISTYEIVINDHLYKLTPLTAFNTSTMKNAPRTWFHEGDFVEYIVNNKREIKSLLLIKRK